MRGTMPLAQASMMVSPCVQGGAIPVSSDDHTQEELERMLATRPKRKLTAEEKVHRRRLQYKLHQRRHRAKQNDRTFELEIEVSQLTERVARLQNEWHLLQNRNVFQSRIMLSGAPAAAATQYVHHFQYGYSPRYRDTQEQFLRSIMLDNVNGPDYEGISVLMEQCALYGSLFVKTQCVPDTVEVTTAGEMTVVVINAVLTLYPRRSGVLGLCPNLVGNELLVQAMIGNPIAVPTKLRFVFEQSGMCSWFGTDMDFVAGLQRSLGSLDNIAACIEDDNARFSYYTGQIAPDVAV